MRTTAIGVVAIPCAIATVSSWTRDWTSRHKSFLPDSPRPPAPQASPLGSSGTKFRGPELGRLLRVPTSNSG